jgi:hypothetical protein
MRQAVRVWELLREGDREQRGRHIQWGPDPDAIAWVRYVSHPELAPGQSPPDGECPTEHEIAAARGDDGAPCDDGLWGSLQPGDVLMPARFFLQQTVNGHLEEEVTPGLVWDPGQERLVYQSTPRSLLGAMWLQFARAVSGDKQYRRCQECGRWYEVSREAARAHRIFCSQGCRSKAYRLRQERARQLFTQGWSFRHIAEELGSDVPTVTKWVTGMRED